MTKPETQSGGSLQRRVRIYPESMEWVVETSHGIHSELGWGFSMRADSREEAIRICHKFRWDRIRAYNNNTGEIIDKPNPQRSEGCATTDKETNEQDQTTADLGVWWSLLGRN